MKKLSLVFAFVLFNLNVLIAQNSLLFEISGNNLSKPSYLLGTMHTLCPEDFQIKDKVWKALENSEKLIFEIDYTNPAEIQDLMALSQGSEPLSKTLTESQKNQLEKNLALYGKTLAEVENLSISSVYMILVQNAIKCAPEQIKMYEIELLKVAMGQQKTFGGLETVKSQFLALEKTYSTEETIKSLALKDDYDQLFKQMVQYFNAEDLTKLDLLLRDDRFMNADQQYHMLTVRNQNWAKKMPEIMKENSTLFAVGSGHLAGKNGVINLLKAQGYTVKAIN